jgi:RNA polymerase sigma-70 factor (ECF subfamily)
MSKHQLTEDERIAAGDKVAMETALARFATERRFYNMAYKFLKTHEEAEDAVQDAYVNALRKWQQFRGGSRFSTWFTRVVICCALMKVRARRPLLSLSEEALGPSQSVPAATVEAPAITEQRRERLLEAVASLEGAHEKEAVRHMLSANLTAREVAAIMDVPVGTAKTYILRAKACLRESLSGRV